MALPTCNRRMRNWSGPRRGQVELSMTRAQCEALIAATRAAFPDFRGRLAPRRVRVGDWHRCEAWNVMHFWDRTGGRGLQTWRRRLPRLSANHRAAIVRASGRDVRARRFRAQRAQLALPIAV